MEQIIDIYNKEICIFQDSQDAEIEEQRQSDDQPPLFVRFRLFERKSSVPGRQGRCGDEDDETAAVRNIIHVAYDEQPDPLELFGNDIIYKKRYDNKKDE